MAESKPWWETDLEWTLRGTMKASGEFVRSIPQAVAAYRLGKPAHEEVIDEMPVEKFNSSVSQPNSGACEKQEPKPVRPAPRVMAPPPAPPRPLPTQSAKAAPAAPVVRAVNMDGLGAQPSSRGAAGAERAFMKFPELSNSPVTARIRDIGEQTLTRIRLTIEEKGLTLDQLLDPDAGFDPKKSQA